MLPGRELINEIEQTLYDLDVLDWELSGSLEDYIIDNGEYLLKEWQDIKNNFAKKSKREQLNLMLDVIQSEAYSEREELEARMSHLDKIDEELERLIEWEDEEGF